MKGLCIRNGEWSSLLWIQPIMQANRGLLSFMIIETEKQVPFEYRLKTEWNCLQRFWAMWRQMGTSLWLLLILLLIIGKAVNTLSTVRRKLNTVGLKCRDWAD